jgi:uncharacterized protein YdeI (YjbR/CyaY-like superfamily)
MKQLFCATLDQWQEWLRNNHRKEKEVWLIFLKKAIPGQSLDYDSSLDSALCYGWIDSLIKKIDDTRYARKFTPRKPNSKWSPENKKRVERLIEDRQMKESGYAVIKIAKENGRWEKPDRPATIPEVPAEWETALRNNRKAKEGFQQLAPTYQKRYCLWIATAKRPETREKRIREALELLEKGEKLPLK